MQMSHMSTWSLNYIGSDVWIRVANETIKWGCIVRVVSISLEKVHAYFFRHASKCIMSFISWHEKTTNEDHKDHLHTASLYLTCFIHELISMGIIPLVISTCGWVTTFKMRSWKYISILMGNRLYVHNGSALQYPAIVRKISTPT